MEKATRFTLQEGDKKYNVVAGEHLAIIYYPGAQIIKDNDDPTEDRHLIYQINPIITIYGNRYIAPVRLTAESTYESDIESNIQWILAHDDVQSTEEYWMYCSSDKHKDITIGRIVSQDPNVIYISYNKMDGKDGATSSTYCLIFIQDVDWRKFNDVHTTEVEVIGATLIGNRYNCLVRPNANKLIHIHE